MKECRFYYPGLFGQSIFPCNVFFNSKEPAEVLFLAKIHLKLQIYFLAFFKVLAGSHFFPTIFAGWGHGWLDLCGRAGWVDLDCVKGVWQDAGGWCCQVQLRMPINYINIRKRGKSNKVIMNRGNVEKSLQTVRDLMTWQEIDRGNTNNTIRIIKRVIHISIDRETFFNA